MTTRKQASIERRNQIIDAALDVFSTKGFQATTNRDIAAAAGINSPGLIYHYFDSQDDLFRAVLEERMPLLQLTQDEVSELMAQPPRVVLALLAQTFLETMSEPKSVALIRLIMGEALRQPYVANLVYHSGSVHLLGFVYRYLEELMARGEIRAVDPGAAARCFLGPLFVYMFTTLILELPDPQTPDAQTLIETIVETFLHGVASS